MYIDTLYAWNVEFLKVKPGGTHNKIRLVSK